MAFTPYGQGRRICIGITFAELMCKMALVRVLRKYSLRPSELTPKELTFIPESLFLRCREKLHVQVELRAEAA